MVVLPDYQGIGIGIAFENYTSKHYADLGWNINITTTTPALVHALCRDENWNLVRASREGNNSKGWLTYKKTSGERLHTSAAKNRITYSFNWKRDATN